MYRLFVGIALPEDVRARLTLLAAGLPGARWVEADALHLTLRFIGEVDGGRGEDIHLGLSQVQAPAFSLTMAGIDVFAQSGKVHTLWAGVDKEPLLAHLRDKVESAVVRAGLEPERRRFKPHVTLARFKNGADERLGGYLARNNPFRMPPFAVTAFTLFRSRLSAAGAHYEALAEYALDEKKGRRSQPPVIGGAPASASGS